MIKYLILPPLSLSSDMSHQNFVISFLGNRVHNNVHKENAECPMSAVKKKECSNVSTCLLGLLAVCASDCISFICAILKHLRRVALFFIFLVKVE